MKILSATLALPVRDLARSREWYRQLFGYPPTVEPAPGVLELELGPVWLQLYEKQGVQGDAALRLGVANLKKLHSRLREAGFRVEDISHVEAVISYFDFKDPDGNGLTFYQLPGDEDDEEA